MRVDRPLLSRDRRSPFSSTEGGAFGPPAWANGWFGFGKCNYKARPRNPARGPKRRYQYPQRVRSNSQGIPYVTSGFALLCLRAFTPRGWRFAGAPSIKKCVLRSGNLGSHKPGREPDGESTRRNTSAQRIPSRTPAHNGNRIEKSSPRSRGASNNATMPPINAPASHSNPGATA